MNEMNEELIIKKAQLFKDKQEQVHIETKSGIFYNGTINYIGADFIEIYDRKLGATWVFFQEIIILEHFLERVKEGGRNGEKE